MATATTKEPSYTGPPMPELLANHTLADAIIEHHPLAPANILDNSELALLRAYVCNPSNVKELLAQSDMVDKEGDRPGTRAQKRWGSLAGYVVAAGALDEREIKLLKEWFDSGAAGDLDGVEVTGPKTREPKKE
jgi:hypothetical protein